MALEEAVLEELRAFEMGSLDPARFPHAEHVRFGYEMLGRHSFGDAVDRFSRGLRLLVMKTGRPQVYHETVTIAFLALINERRALRGGQGWSDFKRTNADLFDKRCLEKWYSAEQLASDLARRTFCLPQPAAV
ncbi:MAG TPA: hypothetical protein VLO30_06140 [Chthoniobacterales bacterium]|nr:hypothetical protein [Chthoniobacterales bacterium]